MKALTITLGLLLIVLSSYCQSDSTHQKVYHVHVLHKSGLVTDNILSDVSDSSLFVIDKSGKIASSFSYNDVMKIKIRRKGSVGKGILIGAGTGVVIGASIGAITYRPPTYTTWVPVYSDKASSVEGGAILGGLSGLIVGAIVGSLPVRTFKVNYDYHTFSNQAIEIKKYCLNTKQ